MPLTGENTVVKWPTHLRNSWFTSTGVPFTSENTVVKRTTHRRNTWLTSTGVPFTGENNVVKWPTHLRNTWLLSTGANRNPQLKPKKLLHTYDNECLAVKTSKGQSSPNQSEHTDTHPACIY